MGDGMQLDAAEREALLAEFDRLRAQPLPASKGPAAFAMLAAGLVVLLLGPRALHPSGLAAVAVLALAAALMLAGALLWVFGGTAFDAWRGRAEDAVAWLVSEFPGEADERRRAAVAAIFYAFAPRERKMVPTYDFAAAAQQMGAALGYVQAVEKALRASARLSGGRDIFISFSASRGDAMEKDS